MKVSVYIDKKVNPVQGYEPVELMNVDLLDDAGIEEIISYHTFEYVYDYKNLLVKLLTKLRYGGELHIIGTDFNEVVRNYTIGNISFDKIFGMLYSGRNNITSLEEIVNMFKREENFKIIKKKLYDNRYALTVKRENAKLSNNV